MIASLILALAAIPVLSFGIGMDRQTDLDARHERALSRARAALESCRERPFDEAASSETETVLDEDADPTEVSGGDAAHPIRVTVVGKVVEEGLVKWTATARFKSVTGSEATVELSTLRGRPDQSAMGRYDLPEVVR